MLDIEPNPLNGHSRPMSSKELSALIIPALAIVAIVVPSPLRAQTEQKSVIRGRCEYSEPVTRHRNEATLVLCDTATISRSSTGATLDFGQRSWGSIARFTGNISGDKISVDRVTLRDGDSLVATGTCEMFRQDDGRLSAIRCLARAAARWVAANFVPSRL
jgi:hypothetical protein